MKVKKLFEVKFKNKKYKIYENKTLDNTYYDVKLYTKIMFLWFDYGIFIENKERETRYEYIRFKTYDKMMKYVFKKITFIKIKE